MPSTAPASIGAHKTGTTSIQKALAASERRLARAGLTYPQVCWFHHAQHRLAFAMKGIVDRKRRDVPDFDAEVEALLGALGDCRGDVVISSEEFFAAPGEAVELLANRLRGVRVRIVAFVRRQDRLLASTWNQRAKQPGNRFVRPLAAFVDQPETLSRDLDLLGCLRTWERAFGREAMIVRRFEEGDALATFADALGRPGLLKGARQPGLNPSVAPQAVELMRLAKLVGADVEAQRMILREARQVFPDATGGAALSGEQAERVLARFTADNAEIFEDYGLGPNVYAPECLVSEDAPDLAPLDRRAMMTFILHVLKKPEIGREEALLM